MRAAVLERAGERLRIETIPVPVPRAGEVLLRVEACGVCHTDLHVIRGEVAFPTPAVVGHEVSGTVVQVGPGVDSVAVGQAVVSPFIMPCGTCWACRQGRDDLCERFFQLNRLRGTLYDGETRLHRADGSPLAMYSMGGMAEYCVVPATSVFPLPSAVPLADSAILGCAVFTAYGAVRRAGDVRPGARVAVVAVGGVGSTVVQLARMLGALEVIAVDVREEKLAAARRLGATDVVNSAQEDPVRAVRERTGGRGVDVAFEVLGRPETFAQALGMVRDGGTLVAVGIAPGDASAPVPITHVVRRGIRIVGSFGARAGADMPTIVDLTAAQRIRPSEIITERVRLEDVPEAYERLARGQIVGRAVAVMRP
ncbi:MAG: zinc-binding dehydrogenase [Firmicutes bacterium]|nr:zinc-binding dehydrogenase [Alicyclobacillaceae bacterium]MCL6496072.1 zinc-binding dehydrogenase [Bacillota bacterium]